MLNIVDSGEAAGRFLLVKSCYETNTSYEISRHISQRSLLAEIEEILSETVKEYQGDVPPYYVRSVGARAHYTNSDSWYYGKSYGIIIQTYSDPTKYTVWFRKRTIGWIKNYWEDIKLFDLFCVLGSSPQMTNAWIEYDCIRSDIKLPFLEELTNKLDKLDQPN